jgi:hypothetical protein
MDEDHVSLRVVQRPVHGLQLFPGSSKRSSFLSSINPRAADENQNPKTLSLKIIFDSDKHGEQP